MNKYAIELFGTMFFVYVILATGNALAIGAALTLAILIGGPISGGAFNPAVVCALVAAGKLPSTELVGYILAEVAGALGGYYLFKSFKM
jgi:glycerol uptake facilitator-like aquaporin